MDPNENLREQLELAKAILEGGELAGDDELDALGERLAELVVALDEWISNGGFLPKRWTQATKEG